MNEFIRGVKCLRIADEYFATHAKGAPKQIRDAMALTREKLRKISNDFLFIQTAATKKLVKDEIAKGTFSLEEKVSLLGAQERLHLEYMVDQMLAPRSEEKEEGEE